MNSRPSPKTGDVLLGCKHEPDPYADYIFQVPRGLPFTRPDGSKSVATWIVLCDACFTRHGVKASNAPLACDFTWKESDRPIVYKEPS